MMKKVLLFLFGIGCFSVFAQSTSDDFSIKVADVDIMKIDGLEYIELVGMQKMMSFDVIVTVDYGQKMTLGSKAQTIRDESRGQYSNGTGVNKDFHSMIDALNFFNSRGWEYVNQYAITTGSSNVYHILLRRKH